MCRSDFVPCEWPSSMFKDGLRSLIGSASVSSVLVIKRNFFNNVENNFDQHLSFYLLFYVRCVGNLFAIFNSLTDAQLFLNLLNNLRPNVRFTCEEVSGPSVPFLDVELTICGGEFNVSVYQKPTFTGVLLQFNSIAPLSSKRGFIYHAYLYSSNNSLLKTKFTFIVSSLKWND